MKLAAEEFAPGLPVKGKISPLPKVKKPEEWEFSAHPHLAERAGKHIDLRLGNPETGVAHSFVIPKRDQLPGPGKSSRVIPTSDHTIPYMDFVGTIPQGYGKGKVVQGRRERTEVYHAEPGDEPGTKLRFNLYEGTEPEEFSIRRDKDGKFFIHNKTQTRERRPDIPAFKPKYKEISVDDVDVNDERQALMPKLDGAHALIDLKAGRAPRLYSYREAKKARTGLIEHTHKAPRLLEKKVPKSLDGTVLRGELLAVDKQGRPIPAEQIGGLLNSKVWESRRKQGEMGVELKAFPFSVVKHKGRDMEDAPFSEKLKVLQKVMENLPELEHPPIATTPEDKASVLKAISMRKHPLTDEGVVLVDKDQPARPIKAKFAPDYDVYIRAVHAARKKEGGTHERAGAVSYSWTPEGPVVGQLGGFKHEEGREMLADPEKFIGRVAKVKAMKRFGTEEEPGALFQPRFKEWHLDKGDIEKQAQMGKCLRQSLAEIKKDPSLKLMVGPPDKGYDTRHFWAETKSGRVVDPTRKNYPYYSQGKPLDMKKNAPVLKALEKSAEEAGFNWHKFREGIGDEGIPMAGATLGAGLGTLARHRGLPLGPLTGAALGYAGGSGASLLRSKLKGERPTMARKLLAYSGLGYGIGGLTHGAARVATKRMQPGLVKSMLHGVEGAPRAFKPGVVKMREALIEEGVPALGATLASGYALGSHKRLSPTVKTAAEDPNAEALAKARQIKQDLSKKYNVRPYLAGSLAMGTNLPGESDYDFGIPVQRKKKFLELANQFEKDMTPSPYNRDNTDYRVFQTEVGGEPVDVALIYGGKGVHHRDAINYWSRRLSDQQKQKIIDEKKRLKGAWILPKVRYKRYKRKLDDKMGIPHFGRWEMDEGKGKAAEVDPRWQLKRRDVFGHRTADLTPIIESGRLLSASEVARLGNLKSYEPDRWSRNRVEYDANDAPPELRSEVFVTKGLLPAESSYGRYGVLVRSRKAVPSRYINTVPEEHVVLKKVQGKMTFIVPDEEYADWTKKYPHRRIIKESEVPEEKRLKDESSWLEVPKRFLRIPKFSHETETVMQKAAFTAIEKGLAAGVTLLGAGAASAAAKKKTAELKPNVRLRPHQLAAVQRIESADGRGLLAHGTGTGKTLSSIAAVERLREAGKANRTLVLTPASLQTNFSEKGVKKFTDSTVGPVGSDADYQLMSLEKFRKDPEKYLEESGADTMIVDEMHRAKDPGSKTYKALREASDKVENFVGLTGSFISNHPKEVVPLMDIAHPEHRLGSQTGFSRSYVQKVDKRKGWLFGPVYKQTQLKNKPRLAKNIQAIHYVGHEDLAAEMPKMEVETVKTPMTQEQKKLYDFALGGLSETERRKIREGLPMSQSEAQHIFAKLMKARQASNSIGTHKSMSLVQAAESTPKLRKVMDDVEEHIEDTKDARPIVYTNFVRGGAEELAAGFRARGLKPGLYTGQNKKERDQELAEFKKGKRDVMILTPAGGEGVSIDNATFFGEVDRHYNPEKNQQAIARGRRLGGLRHRAPEDRVLLVKRYYSDPRTSFFDRLIGKKESGIDEWIGNVAAEKDRLNEEMRGVAMKMKAASEVAADPELTKEARTAAVKFLYKLISKGTPEALEQAAKLSLPGTARAFEQAAARAHQANAIAARTLKMEGTAVDRLRRLREAGKTVSKENLETVARTRGGMSGPGTGGRSLARLGRGGEGTADLVVHPEYGMSVRKLYDPKGIASKEIIKRKADLAKAVQGTPDEALFAKMHGGGTTRGGGDVQFSEFLPGAVTKSKKGITAQQMAKIEEAGARRGYDLRDVRPANIDPTTGKALDYIPAKPGEIVEKEVLQQLGYGPNVLAYTDEGMKVFRGNRAVGETSERGMARLLGPGSRQARKVRGALPGEARAIQRTEAGVSPYLHTEGPVRVPPTFHTPAKGGLKRSPGMPASPKYVEPTQAMKAPPTGMQSAVAETPASSARTALVEPQSSVSDVFASMPKTAPTAAVSAPPPLPAVPPAPSAPVAGASPIKPSPTQVVSPKSLQKTPSPTPKIPKAPKMNVPKPPQVGAAAT